MKLMKLLAWAVIAATLIPVHGSDRTAVYARVDRVVLEPNDDAPEAIHVWGVFSLAKPNDPNEYLPPAKGYLYFRLPAAKEVARREWADLKAAAGTGNIVSFGSRWELRARVRPGDEKPAAPDPYSVNVGITKVGGNTTYAPVRALIEYRD